jgi:hypothetical protein
MKTTALAHKRPHERAIKKSVSMPQLLYYAGVDRQRDGRFATFSDYVQHLIRTDTIREAA